MAKGGKQDANGCQKAFAGRCSGDDPAGFVFFFYGMLETGHVCSGQRCGICAQLALSQAALENPAFPGLIILSVFALLLLERVFHQTLRAWVCCCGTPIGWKVRLNN